MAKLTAFVFVLIAATALVSASAYSMEGSCQREMQQWMPMRHCMMYMQSRMRGPYNADNRKFREDHLSQCCDELRNFSSECRCDAVSEMMDYMPQMQMQEMERMACRLPSMCGMRDCGCASY